MMCFLTDLNPAHVTGDSDMLGEAGVVFANASCQDWHSSMVTEML